MKVIMYGSPICINCLEAYEVLQNRDDITLDYRIITESIPIMKEFLSYRDKDSMFDLVKKEGKVGIPFFLLEDGRKTFELDDFIKRDNNKISSCSIDNKGQC